MSGRIHKTLLTGMASGKGKGISGAKRLAFICITFELFDILAMLKCYFFQQNIRIHMHKVYMHIHVHIHIRACAYSTHTCIGMGLQERGSAAGSRASSLGVILVGPPCQPFAWVSHLRSENNT